MIEDIRNTVVEGVDGIASERLPVPGVGHVEVAIVRHSPVPMLLSALDGRTLMANQPFCELLGYSEDEMFFLDHTDMTHPSDLDQTMREVSELIENPSQRSFTIDKRLVTKDGSDIQVRRVLRLVTDTYGAPSHFMIQIAEFSKEVRPQTMCC